jgi:hypothetical protein
MVSRGGCGERMSSRGSRTPGRLKGGFPANTGESGPTGASVHKGEARRGSGREGSACCIRRSMLTGSGQSGGAWGNGTNGTRRLVHGPGHEFRSICMACRGLVTSGREKRFSMNRFGHAGFVGFTCPGGTSDELCRGGRDHVQGIGC